MMNSNVRTGCRPSLSLRLPDPKGKNLKLAGVRGIPGAGVAVICMPTDR